MLNVYQFTYKVKLINSHLEKHLDIDATAEIKGLWQVIISVSVQRKSLGSGGTRCVPLSKPKSQLGITLFYRADSKT